MGSTGYGPRKLTGHAPQLSAGPGRTGAGRCALTHARRNVLSVSFRVTFLLLVTAAAGCARPTVTLQDGEALYLEGDYDAAIAVLKEYLIEHPEDAGAHFYLGSCYRLWRKGWFPLLAQGEIETAQALYERSGGKSPIPRFPDTYFALRCQTELANVFLRHLAVVERLQADPGLTALLVRRIEMALEEARRIDPAAPEVAQLQDIVSGLREAVAGAFTLPPARRPPSPGLPG